MTGVPLVSLDQATDEQRRVLSETAASRGEVLNLFRAMAHCPGGTSRVSAVGSYLRYESVLPDRLRELLILAMSGRWGCDYERRQHESIARKLGIEQTSIDSLTRAEVPPGLDALEDSAVRYALALAQDGRPDSALAASLHRALGEHGLVELHLVVGYYSLLAMFLNGLQVEPDASS